MNTIRKCSQYLVFALVILCMHDGQKSFLFAQQQSIGTVGGTNTTQKAAQSILPLIRVQRLTDLSCGVTILGIQREIRFSDAAAARFRITAPALSEILVSLTLPMRLVCGSAETPLTFGNASAAWSERDSPSLGSTTFNPLLQQRIKVPQTGIIFVWIGCSLAPAKNLRSGRYTSLMQLEASLVVVP